MSAIDQDSADGRLIENRDELILLLQAEREGLFDALQNMTEGAFESEPEAGAMRFSF